MRWQQSACLLFKVRPHLFHKFAPLEETLSLLRKFLFVCLHALLQTFKVLVGGQLLSAIEKLGKDGRGFCSECLVVSQWQDEIIVEQRVVHLEHFVHLRLQALHFALNLFLQVVNLLQLISSRLTFGLKRGRKRSGCGHARASLPGAGPQLCACCPGRTSRAAAVAFEFFISRVLKARSLLRLW